MSSIIKSQEFDVENFVRALECPVGLDLLKEAVSLVPCMHKVNTSTAKKLYGGMVGGKEVKKPGLCPVCKRAVTAYYEDHFTRGIVELLQKKSVLLPKISAQIQAEYKEKSVEKVPFPGNPAEFELDRGDWGIVNSPRELLRQLSFRCIAAIAEPLFKEFTVLGYKDGRLGIRLELSKNEKLCDYFAALGLTTLDTSQLAVGYVIVMDKKARDLFAVIAQNNKIPEPYYTFVRTLFEKGDWRKVTPGIEPYDFKAAEKG